MLPLPVVVVCSCLFAAVSPSNMSKIRVHGKMMDIPTFNGKLGSLTVNGKMGSGVVFENDVGDHFSVNGTVHDNVRFGGIIGDRVKINGRIKEGAVLLGTLGSKSAINGMIESSVVFPDSIPDGFSFNGEVRKDSSGNTYVWNDVHFESSLTFYVSDKCFCDQRYASKKCKSFNATFASPPGAGVVFKGRVGKNVRFDSKVGAKVVFACDIPDEVVFSSDIPDGSIIGKEDLKKFSKSPALDSAAHSTTSLIIPMALFSSLFIFI